jgi:hypothetical protein
MNTVTIRGIEVSAGQVIKFDNGYDMYVAAIMSTGRVRYTASNADGSQIDRATLSVETLNARYRHYDAVALDGVEVGRAALVSQLFARAASTGQSVLRYAVFEKTEGEFFGTATLTKAQGKYVHISTYEVAFTHWIYTGQTITLIADDAKKISALFA